MSRDFVLDAWALLAFLQGEEPASTRVHDVFQDAQLGNARLFVSMINIGEIYYRVGKTRTPIEADSVLADLYLLPMEILSADDETVLAAARLKMAYAISYADAFAAVTSKQRGAVLLTGDPELVELEHVLRIEKLIR